jgi:hypothetical protein
MQRSILKYMKVEDTFLIKHFDIKKVNDHISEKKEPTFLIKLFN